jgi:hypothetical protein
MFPSPDTITVIKAKRNGQVPHTGNMTNAYNIFVQNPQRKKPHSRPRYRWAILNCVLKHKMAGLYSAGSR